MKKNKQKNSGTDSFPIDEDGNVWVVWGQPELYRLKLSNLKKIANSDWTEDEDGKQIRHKIVDNHGKTHMMTKSEAYFHIIDIPKKIIKLTESDLTRIVKRVLKESFMEERDYDYIMEILSNDGLHPNHGWFDEFENSRFYDEDMTDDEYAESIYDFIIHGDNEY
jgi:hypothetical protein